MLSFFPAGINGEGFLAKSYAANTANTSKKNSSATDKKTSSTNKENSSTDKNAADTTTTPDITTIKPVIHVGQIYEPTLEASISLTISWSKIKEADGYRLYRRLGASGTFSRIKTYKKKSKISYVDTDITWGNQYDYRLRAFCYAKDGSKIFSRYSSIDHIETDVNLEKTYTQKKDEKRLKAIIADLNGKSILNDTLNSNFKASQCLGSAKYLYYLLFSYNDFCTYSSDGLNYTMQGNRFTPAFEQPINGSISAEELKTLFESAYANGTLKAGSWLQYSNIAGNTGTQHSSIFVDFTPEKDGIIVFDGNFGSSMLNLGTKKYSLLLQHSLSYEYLAKLLSNGAADSSYKCGISAYYLADSAT